MNQERVPIRDLRPGDQFRLGGTLPLLTVERVVDLVPHPGYVGVQAKEDPLPIHDEACRLVQVVRRAALSLVLLACIAGSVRADERASIRAVCQQGIDACGYFQGVASGPDSQRKGQRLGYLGTLIGQTVRTTDTFQSIRNNTWRRMLDTDWKAFNDAQTLEFQVKAVTHMSDDWARLAASQR